jgi:hypothetical protein
MVTGRPKLLIENSELSFQGSIVLGSGFVLSTEAAKLLIQKNPKNSNVLFPYLRGEDFTSHPTQSPSTWVINFFDWPLSLETAGKDYSGPVASDYPDCFEIIESLVKPERTRTDDEGKLILRKPLPEKWWIYADKRPALYKALKGKKRVLFHSFTAKYVVFAFVPTGMVYAGPHNVFLLDAYHQFAVLQSTFHESWAWDHCSRMRLDIRYANGDLFGTFPFPTEIGNLDSLGEEYHQLRASIMKNRQIGLTETYNLIHNPVEQSGDIGSIRHLQVKMDMAVALAYGWSDLNLEHDFNETKQGLRYTISDASRRLILDRLLDLNHRRHAEAEAAKAVLPLTAYVKRGRKAKDNSDQITLDL